MTAGAPGTRGQLAGRARAGLATMTAVTVLLYVIEIVNMATFGLLSRMFGIRPRDVGSLPDILTSPLVHDSTSWAHLLANTLPLFVFGLLAFLAGLRQFLTAVALSWVASGIGVWLFGGSVFGHPGITVGASGVIFGLFGFLLVRGFFNRSWWQILLAVVLFAAYGSVLLGILPTVGRGISWQAHLFGLAGGVIAAVMLRPRGRTAS
ncbi:rhomboid family intramembrane serine protease [Sinomonas sp. ASV486]|uniref:rhomboid family intramembrane serine protease n=1 Tax=Sinomonas sp. ASV486 TaxID=3051170 RepID=UPI0027DE06E0|nr:rhomboid family intramembrane serine protease [Sinomonas sp. ASV486]MDQ4490282.1 rhomboid family intramembrane serine protease [Sinomonas sp. ASV486]